ncbi:MFS transporter [Streptomyces benahoarensis]|uniref:MFS transporter n=1 Tax=Streptomyces benahoarensis TaxID=2595054 RepID=UPI0020355043|nr:MFS transporter [Streptomyces benahoarensis]
MSSELTRDKAAAADGSARTPGWRLVAPLLVGSALNPINSSILATALVPIARSLGVNIAATAVLVSALYLASAIAQPTMGRLAERFGPRRVFLAGLSLVGAGGILGTLAPNLTTLTVARVLLGIGTAGGYPTAMMIVRRFAERHPEVKVGGTLGALSAAGLVTAAVGLPIGGALVAVADWRATFLVNVPMALIGIVMTLCWVPADDRSGTRAAASLLSELDPPGMVLFASTVTCMLLFCGDLAHPDWLLLAATLLLAVALVLWERRARLPFIDVRMLARNRPLSMTYLRVGATLLIPYCILYGLSQWLAESRGMSAITVSLLLLPMSFLASVVTIPFSRRQLVRGPLIAAAAAALVGSLAMVRFSHGTPVAVIAAVTLVFGVTTGLGSVGNQTVLFAQSPAEQVGVASGLLRTSTNLGAIMSASLVSLALGNTAGDAGLHVLGLALAGLATLLLLATVFDRLPAHTR